MTMAELLELGAPKLPEGMFYRVRIGTYAEVHIEIREDRKRFGSRVLESHFYYPDAFTLAEMCISCFKLFTKNHKDRLDMSAKYAEIKKFVGDHR